MDRLRVQCLIRELLSELDEDPLRSGLAETPERVTDLLALFADHKSPLLKSPGSSEQSDRRVMTVLDFEFTSLCEHHLLPFFGRVHIGCIPRERACDAILCAQVVERLTHRLQLQERLTEQIADALVETLAPDGIGVTIRARHLCITMRGVGKQNSEIHSSALRGCFIESATRRAFLAHIMRGASG